MPRSQRSRRRLLGAAALGSLLSTVPALRAAAARPRASVGRLERLEGLPFRQLEPRPVEVWLPPDYEAKVQQGRRFAVLYMHDGQMLFDVSSTWNRQAWELDRAAQALMQAGAVRDFIVVAPWNAGPLRHSEYFPTGFLPHLPDALRQQFVERALQGRSRCDDYLRFLVAELKPAVDARYATRPGRESCFLMGSSMGGLVSAYALWEHPEVFGGAACLSTHWIGSFERNRALPDAAIAYLRSRPPQPQSLRLWTDRGTEELDALYDEAHARVSDALRELGFREPDFQAPVLAGTGHNERDWSRRVAEPLRFLLGPAR